MTRGIRKSVLGMVERSEAGRAAIARAQIARRKLRREDEGLRARYLKSTAEPKLQVGGGWRVFEGWLNADLDLVPGVMRMDATEPFPLPEASFDYVYSEHMIEHVPYLAGAAMLAECHRVLKPGGVIRIITPDLQALAGLYAETPSDLQRRYVEWFCASCLEPGVPHTAAAALNAQFRLWGHQFIYDEKTLTSAMETAGFGLIRRVRLGESEHAALQGLEHRERYPEGFLELESVALEGKK